MNFNLVKKSIVVASLTVVFSNNSNAFVSNPRPKRRLSTQNVKICEGIIPLKYPDGKVVFKERTEINGYGKDCFHIINNKNIKGFEKVAMLIEDYTYNSAEYNGFERNPKCPTLTKNLGVKNFMISTFLKYGCETVKHDFKVFRGISMSNLQRMLGSEIRNEKDLIKLKGKVLKDKGFISCSVIEKSSFKKGVMLEIKIPKGFVGAEIHNLSSFPYEREFLLDRNQKFMVTDVIIPNESDNKLERLKIKCEVVKKYDPKVKLE